jgi:hypothetical protein
VTQDTPPSATPTRSAATPVALRVSGRLTEADFGLLAAELYGHAMGPWRTVVAVAPAVAGAIGAALGLGLSHAFGFGEGAQIGLVCTAALGAAMGATALAQRFAYRRQIADNGAFLRPFQLEADADGVTIRSEAAATRLMWEAVRAVRVSPAFVLLYTDEAAAVALPARAFRDEASMKAFGDRATVLWRAARKGEAP